MPLNGIKEHQLSNGLKVICLKKGGAPIVAVDIWYRTGSINETNGIKGLSHFLEHMMFRGSAKFEAQQHMQKVNDVGGHCNAMTAEDITAYTNCVPRDCLDMVLELEADRMCNAALGKELFETERKVILEELRNYLDNPVFKAFLELRKELFNAHPYAIGPQGTLEDVAAVTLDQCKEYYKTWYTPDNAVIVVVGDFESETELLAKIEDRFGGIAQHGKVERSTQVLPKVQDAGPVWISRKIDFEVPMLIAGYPAPPSYDADAIYLDIIQAVLCQGETGRLHRELVRKHAVAVMAGGMNHFLKYAGMSLFFAIFTPDVSVKKVRNALLEQIDIIVKNGVSDTELEKIKNATLTNRVFEMYSAEQVCQRIGFSETVEGDYRQWVKRIETLENLDKSRLIDVAQLYLSPQRRHCLYIKPKRIKPMLLIAGLLRRLTPKSKK